jgi:hypothetical protein
LVIEQADDALALGTHAVAAPVPAATRVP